MDVTVRQLTYFKIPPYFDVQMVEMADSTREIAPCFSRELNLIPESSKMGADGFVINQMAPPPSREAKTCSLIEYKKLQTQTMMLQSPRNPNA